MIRKIILVLFLSLFLCSCSSPTPAPENIQKTVKNENVEIMPSEIPETTEEEIVDDKTEIENNTEEVIVDDIIKINCSKKELECCNLINNYRQENGLDILTWDDTLYEYAKIRAREASQCWSHTRPDGTSWKEIDPNTFQGENLAKGYDTAQDAVSAWIASQGHKDNILRGSFNRTAIAFYNAENGWFWCQTFGY